MARVNCNPVVLFSWNPKHMKSGRYQWDAYENPEAYVRRVNRRGHWDHWNIGRRASVPGGARIILVRTGSDRPGIVMSGELDDGTVYRAGDKRRYVELRWTRALNWDERAPLRLSDIFDAKTARYIGYNLQQSGYVPKKALGEEIWAAWGQYLQRYSGLRLDGSTRGCLVLPEVEVDEGNQSIVRSIRRSRVATWRKQLINESTTCAACGCKRPDGFADLGNDGLRIFEVHHREAIRRGPRRTRASDLAVLCRNCHALAHVVDPPLEPAIIGRRLGAQQSRRR